VSKTIGIPSVAITCVFRLTYFSSQMTEPVIHEYTFIWKTILQVFKNNPRFNFIVSVQVRFGLGTIGFVKQFHNPVYHYNLLWK